MYTIDMKHHAGLPLDLLVDFGAGSLGRQASVNWADTLYSLRTLSLGASVCVVVVAAVVAAVVNFMALCGKTRVEARKANS